MIGDMVFILASLLAVALILTYTISIVMSVQEWNNEEYYEEQEQLERALEEYGTKGSKFIIIHYVDVSIEC